MWRTAAQLGIAVLGGLIGGLLAFPIGMLFSVAFALLIGPSAFLLWPAVCGLGVYIGGSWAYDFAAERLRFALIQCQNCGYSLMGSTGEGCPECGYGLTLEQMQLRDAWSR